MLGFITVCIIAIALVVKFIIPMRRFAKEANDIIVLYKLFKHRVKITLENSTTIIVHGQYKFVYEKEAEAYQNFEDIVEKLLKDYEKFGVITSIYDFLEPQRERLIGIKEEIRLSR